MPTNLLNANDVLAEVAAAIPPAARRQVIIVGSLAAAYFYRDERRQGVRTKDVDALFSPHAKAVAAAVQVTEQLLDANWTMRQGEKFNEPGKPGDELEALPMVRLKPPAARQDDHWFLELMAAPDEYRPGAPGKDHQRVSTKYGDFAPCSFSYLALAEWRPIKTEHGVLIARPEMMALANLLHHPTIAETLINDGSGVKRSNKDLGRVLALAYLARAREMNNNREEVSAWADHMALALREKFGADAAALAARAGDGIRALLASEADLVQALATAQRGLLSSVDLGLAGFAATGRRLLADVLEPLANVFSGM